MDPLAAEALSPAAASFWKEARGQSCTCMLFSHLRVRTPLSPDCMMVSGQLRQVGAWILALGSHTHQMGTISPDFLAERMKVALGCTGWAGLHRS